MSNYAAENYYGVLNGTAAAALDGKLSTTGKAADSDLLDGIDSTGFVKTSGNETVAGIKTFSSQPAISAAQGSGANDILKYGTIATANSAPVKTALNAGGSAPIYACRAWVNFNGTDTVAIRASGNVSSITDNGVGNYTVNFTTAMPDVNYSNTVIINPNNTGGNADLRSIGFDYHGTQSAAVFNRQSTSQARVAVISNAGSFGDVGSINVTIFR